MLRPVLMALLLSVTTPSPAVSQAAAQPTVTVTVEIDDRAVGGLISSAFRAALRQLGDVSVTALNESTNYIISGVVMCVDRYMTDNCDDVITYQGALSLQEPLHLGWLLTALTPESDPDPKPTFDQILRWAPRLAGFRANHATWVTQWGANVYQREVQELVGMIDAQCFERTRLALQTQSAPSAQAVDALRAQINDESRWMC